VGKNSWLFKKINLGLRMEVIANISILMLAAILLIGFTIAKINEQNIIDEKVRGGEVGARFSDVLTISRDQKAFLLSYHKEGD
jgi:hypothetical protein